MKKLFTKKNRVTKAKFQKYNPRNFRQSVEDNAKKLEAKE